MSPTTHSDIKATIHNERTALLRAAKHALASSFELRRWYTEYPDLNTAPDDYLRAICADGEVHGTLAWNRQYQIWTRRKLTP